MKTGALKINKRLLSILLTIVMFVGLVPVADLTAYADYTVTITVTDSDENPIDGVQVIFNGSVTYTNNHGQATITIVGDDPSDVPCKFFKNGYVGITNESLSFSKENPTATVIMKKPLSSFFTKPTGLIYNAKQQALVTVSENLPEDSTVEYTINDTTVINAVLTASDVGKYTVEVKATCDGYVEYNDIFTDVEIAKNPTRIIHYTDETKEANVGDTTKCYEEKSLSDSEADFGAELDGSVTADGGALSAINGKVEIKYNTTALADTGIVIGTDGKVTWNNNGIKTPAGEYTFTAKVINKPGNDVVKNFTDDAINLSYTLVLVDNGTDDDPLLKFDNNNVTYKLHDATPPAQTAEKKTGDNGTVTYSVASTDESISGGMTVDASGQLAVNDAKLLAMVKAAEQRAAGNAPTSPMFTVTASKTKGTAENGHTLFGEATASYGVNVEPYKFESNLSAKQSGYSVDITSGVGSTPGELGHPWYNSKASTPTKPVIINAYSGRQLAGENDSSYSGSVTLSGNGSGDEFYVYIRDILDNKAYEKVKVVDTDGNPLKIDEDAPDELNVTYTGAFWYSKLAEVVSLGIAKSGAEVTISAHDALSGIRSISWWFEGSQNLKYTVGEGTTEDDVPDAADEAVTVANDEATNSNGFSTTFTLKGVTADTFAKYYRGAIKAKAVDRASNTRDEFTKVTLYTNNDTTENEGDNDTDIIFDDVAPVLSNVSVSTTATGTKSTEGTTDYYSDTVTVGFTMTETNFEADDVVLEVKKDGVKLDPAPTVTWDKEPTPGNEPTEDDPSLNVYNGSFSLSEDGEYTVVITAKDKATNALTGEGVENGKYTYARTIAVTKGNPTYDFSYAAKTASDAGKTDGGKDYIKGDVVYTLTIKDRFFDASKVKVSGTCTLDGTATPFEKTFVKNDFTKGNDNKHTATFTVSDEGEYDLTVSYADRFNRPVAAGTVTANKPVIDKTAPVVTVSYADGGTNSYFTADRAATLKIVDRNVDTSIDGNFIVDNCITAKDVTGADVSVREHKADIITLGTWTDGTGERTLPITFTGEANYVFDVTGLTANKITDLAGNAAVINADYGKTFTIDKTAPNAPDGGAAGTLKFSFDIENANKGKADSVGQWIENILSGIKFGFWNKDIVVTVEVEDDVAGVSGADAVKFTYTRAETAVENGKTVFVSNTNAETLTGTATLRQDGKTNKFTGTFKLPADAVDNKTAQINGTLKVELTDLCGNAASADDSATRVIYDSISPTAEVKLTGIVNTVGDIKYAGGTIGVNLTVTEANFFEDCYKATSNRSPVTISWNSVNADTHNGSFTLNGDGEYDVNIVGMDYAGNEMAAYNSGKLVIDTSIDAPEILVNNAPCDGMAYKDDAVLSISYYDTNFNSVDIKIYRTRLGEKDVDVTDLFIKPGTVEQDGEGGMAYIDTLTKTADNDGIYTVMVTVTDKAQNSASATATFTLNRFGSVYEYGDFLTDLIKDGGKFVKSVDEDLVITEFNADKLIDGSTKVEITRDGKLIKNPIFTVKQVKAPNSERGEKGWYEYQYIISKDNFTEDGVYKVVISSKDATGNRPENSNYKGMEIQFVVDSTSPEITSVTGLEKSIVNAEQVEVKYNVYDSIGLKSIKVYLNGELYEEITDFGDDINNYIGSLIINESNKAQSVRIVVEDLAGNITDTADENFTSAYTMVDWITVSTSFFARFYANKPLFWGCIGGVLLLAIFCGILIPIILKRREEEEEEEAETVR